jgi:predicted permease
MTWSRRLRRRIRALFSKDALDRELNEEMQLHLAMEAEDLARTGVSPDEAARRARIAFGGVERHKEETRDARGIRAIEDRCRDLAYIVRSLRRTPVFTLAVILSLALGIGANSTMFTIISAVLLRPLPYAHADELLGVSMSMKGVVQDQVLEPHFRAWARSSHTLSTLAYYNVTNATIGGAEAPERVTGAAVTSDLFTALQLRPALGRTLLTSDQDSSAEPVIVLSSALWRRHFAADSGMIGRIVQVNDKPRTVVGVLTDGAPFPQKAEFWIPSKQRSTSTAIFYGQVVARPRPHVTVAQVQRELSQIAYSADSLLPKTTRGNQIIVMPLHDQLFGSARPALTILFVAVLLLLLVACANVANLVFARTIQRQREFAVRLTLGATRGTLLGLILAESLLLALAGAAVGLVISFWATRVFVGLSPANITEVSDIGPNGQVFVFTGLLATAAAMLVGIGPALRASRRDPRASLGDGGQREGSGRFATRLRRALVVAQLSIAIVLLAGAGLLIRSLTRLADVDLGFHPDRVLIANVTLPNARYPDGTPARAFFNQLSERIRRAPGVTSSAYGPTPLQGFAGTMELGPPSPLAGVMLAEADVSAGFFETFGVPIREGRGILASDDSASAPVAVINAALARILFPAGGALGHAFDGVTIGKNHPTIVGVVADFPQRDVAVRAIPEIFLASAQNGGYPYTIAARTSGKPEALTAVVRAAVHDLDPALALGTVTTMEKVVASSMAPVRFASLLLGTFAALALVLAALGLYGVVAYGMARRARELGIRAALGATGPMLMRLVAGEMVWVVMFGLSIGLACAWLASRAMQTLLYGTGVHDPLTFVLVPVALIVPAAIATLVPARRAMRVNPVDVIQAE